MSWLDVAIFLVALPAVIAFAVTVSRLAFPDPDEAVRKTGRIRLRGLLLHDDLERFWGPVYMQRRLLRARDIRRGMPTVRIAPDSTQSLLGS